MAKCKQRLGADEEPGEIACEDTGSVLLALAGSDGAQEKKELEMTCRQCGVSPMVWQGEFSALNDGAFS